MFAKIFDTETDDLITTMAMPLARQPEILSLYHHDINLETGEVSNKYYQLFKPSKPIKPEVTTINGITNEMVANKPPFKDAVYLIKKDFEEAPIIIAHNAQYDWDMLNIEFARCGIALRKPRIICTVEQTIWFEGHRLSLTNLHKHLFNEDFEEKHSAQGDVLALSRCCVQLYKNGWLM